MKVCKNICCHEWSALTRMSRGSVTDHWQNGSTKLWKHKSGILIWLTHGVSMHMAAASCSLSCCLSGVHSDRCLWTVYDSIHSWTHDSLQEFETQKTNLLHCTKLDVLQLFQCFSDIHCKLQWLITGCQTKILMSSFGALEWSQEAALKQGSCDQEWHFLILNVKPYVFFW